MKILIHFVVSTIAILITAYVLPGVHVSGLVSAFVLAVVLGIVNTILRPILIILTLPLTVMSFGIWVLFVNALLVLLASYIVPGFSVDGFLWAFLFGIVLTIINWALQSFERED